MDVQIEIYAWDLGYDEANELAEALADTLVARKLGMEDASDDSDETVRCLLLMKPTHLVRPGPNEPETDDGVPVGLDAFLREHLKGATVVLIPGAKPLRS